MILMGFMILSTLFLLIAQSIAFSKASTTNRALAEAIVAPGVRDLRHLGESLMLRNEAKMRATATKWLVLPSYNNILIFVALALLVEAAVYCVRDTPAVIVMRHLVFAVFNKGLDSFFVVLLLHRTVNRRTVLRAVCINLVVVTFYLTFVVLLQPKPASSCRVCNPHVPNKYMFYPYFATATILFALAAANAAGRVGRPMTKWWCLFLAPCYLAVAVALAVREHQPPGASSWPLCLSMLAFLAYAVGYAPMLYVVIRRDSMHVLQRMLEEERKPLLGFTRDHVGAVNRSDGDRGGGATATAPAATATAGGHAHDVAVRVLDGSEIRIDRGPPLASGGFSTVYKGVWVPRESDAVAHIVAGRAHTVAVKQLRLKSAEKPPLALQHESGDEPEPDTATLQAAFLREISLHARFTHDNIVLLHGVLIDHDTALLVMEYVGGGTLFDALYRRSSKKAAAAAGSGGARDLLFDVPAKLRIGAELASAVAYLHGAGVLHRDLKSPNVLLTAGGGGARRVAKLCDFGLSRFKPAHTTRMSTIGTLQWTAPEVILDSPYSKSADIYSLGVLLWELAGAAAPPWHGHSPSKIIATVAVQREMLTVPFGNDERYVALIKECLAFEASSRPTAEQVHHRMKELYTEINQR